MAITVQSCIDHARIHNKMFPLTGIGGISNQPGLDYANKTKKRIISQTLNWDWNRKSEASFLTVNGTEDYSVNATDIYWVERADCVVESDANTPKRRYPIQVVRDLPQNSYKAGFPSKIAKVLNTSGVAKWRVAPMSSSTILRIYIDYQRIPETLTALTGAGGTFDPIPDTMEDVILQFFLAFTYRLVDKNAHVGELAEAERLLREYRKAHIVEESEVGFYPDFNMSLG